MRDYADQKLLIDGRWIDAGDREARAIVNPATGERLADLPVATAADLDEALDASKRAFALWRTVPVAERSRVLREAAGLLRARAPAIATGAVLEEGKPYAEALWEAEGSAALFDFYAGEAMRSYGRVLVRPPGQLSRVVSEPVGPVAAFAPWNFPVFNVARKLGAPVAAGCSVILKPAEESPASATAVVQALLDAGLPAGVVQMVFGVPDTISRHLFASPVIRKLSFTGSTAVGKHLLRLAADTVKRCTMELGGHAPVIILDDADLDRTLDGLATAKLRNAGQVCVSPTRFFVQDGIHDRFAAALIERFEATKVGDGLDDGVQMGPTANVRRPTALDELIQDAVRSGAQVAAGGERLDRPGFFFRPTVLTDVPDSARIMREEPFGPVALVARFADRDEAIARANDVPYGLAGYVFTENARAANLCASGLEVGMVGINTTQLSAADAPFGGVKESGYGHEDGPEGLAACMVTKAVHQH